MSEPELAYMTGNNEDFDLPRWQPHHVQDTLSSSAQAAQAAQQAPFNSLYSSAPPPPPPLLSGNTSHRLPPLVSTHHSGHSGSTRQPRISQLLDEEQQLGAGQHQYQPQLSRSASLGGGTSGTVAPLSGGGAFSRGRRHHIPDDLERAFSSESTQTNTAPRSAAPSQPYPNALYPSSVAYHSPQQHQQSQQQQMAATVAANPTSPTVSSGGGDLYQDAYFTNQSHGSPRRARTQHDQGSTSSRSPRRGQTTDATTSLLDPYSQQQQPQGQYSPTTTSSYQYTSPTDISGAHSSTVYHSHSHSQSQSGLKNGPTSPLASPYAPQNTLPPTPQSAPQSTSQYSSSYAMDTSSPAPPASSQGTHHLPSHTPLSLRMGSVSSPSTPLSHTYPQSPSHGPYYGNTNDSSAMTVEVQHKRRAGFKRVRDQRDLRPHQNAQPIGRRDDGTGIFLSPLKQLTTSITDTYHICNPAFRYESTHNPRRVLTKPSKPAHNDGYDNEDYDYILYVNDYLGTDQGHKYLILDVLGQGTFGQVVKCQNMKTHEIVAVKVIKNKPAYFNQSMMEVTILELLNNQCDPQDEHHLLRLRDSFIHRNHLCLVFELLSSNLYELIKQNQFQGLSTQLVKVFTAQLLDALSVLKEARMIHCDLKPENILLKSLQSPDIKVIDFGSACHERQTVYTYIQSRFYRSPEVLLGIPYTAAIDMWSLGCIAVELFLGLPLFPGTSEYNQITRIVEMLGMPPTYMLEMGKQSSQFFDSYVDHYGQKKWRLKSIEQYSREHNTQEQPGKQYFKATSLPEIINNAPIPNFKSSSRQGHELEKELNNRASFVDFCQGLLNMNPIERWTPDQARMHPFITGEKFTKPFTIPNNTVAPTPQNTTAPATDPKRPYGGLVPSQPKGQRAYQDAATYNQHLAQHQAYTAQAQAASQASSAYRNPYIAAPNSQQQQQQSQPSSRYPQVQDDANVPSPRHDIQYGQVPQGLSQSTSHQNQSGVPSSLQPNPPTSTYFPNSRTRANTFNHNLDVVPPALARLQHMKNDVILGRNALTPVLNREEAMREWERRQAGKPAAAQPYPQLEYLQQQAELAASGLSWTQPSGSSNRYQAQPSSLSNSFQPPTAIVVDEPDRRDAVMSNVRSAARGEQTATNMYNSSAASAISSPPQAYSGSTTTTGNRFATTYTQQQPTSSSPFDSLDRRTDIGSLYAPMQPDQYQTYGQANQSSTAHAAHQAVAPPVSSVPPSFYGAGVVSSGQSPNAPQRNPFTSTPNVASAVGTRENRRSNGMEIWPR